MHIEDDSNVRDFDEFNITQSVMNRFSDAPDARLREVMQRLVLHLHAFIRDVDLSFDEWRTAIQFLTRTGQICSDTRQEFILLSDTLGASMLVDAINHRLRGNATETTVLGPFFVEGAERLRNGADIASGASGVPLLVRGRVTSEEQQPISGAIVEVWQSDSEGFYDVQRTVGQRLRASFETAASGTFHFWSIVPSYYPIPEDGPVGEMLRATKRHPYRPAHVHFMISAAGYEQLITHVFVNGDRYLDSDAVFGVKNSLVGDFEEHAPGAAPDGRQLDTRWQSLCYEFRLKTMKADAKS
jgi:hydroxyquinol 1,2-dioxygenase